MKLLVLLFEGMHYFATHKFDGFERAHVHCPVPLTGPILSAFYTGLSEFEFVDKHKGKNWSTYWEEINFFELKPGYEKHYFWNKLNNADVSVGLVAPTLTYPPFKVNKYLISGFVVPDYRVQDYTYPKDLKLPKSFYPSTCNWYSNDYDDHLAQCANELRSFDMKFLESLIDMEANGKIEFIKNNHDVDFMFVGFTFVDHLSHWLKMADYDEAQATQDVRDRLPKPLVPRTHFGTSQEKNYTELYFKKVKEIYSKIMEICKADNVIIMSDHGIKQGRHDHEAVCLFKGKDLGDMNGFVSKEFVKGDTLTVQDIHKIILKCCGVGY